MTVARPRVRAVEVGMSSGGGDECSDLGYILKVNFQDATKFDR